MCFSPPASTRDSRGGLGLVTAITFIKRKPDMTVAAFQEYWRTRHAEIVVKLPGIRRYVQSHALLAGYGKRELDWDGVAEIRFDSTDAMRALARVPEYALVQADEARFIDRARMSMIIAEEHVIKNGTPPDQGVKSIEFLSRKPGMAVADFQRYWREVHGPIAATIPVLRRYVQSHTRPSGYEGGRVPAYDGVAVTWFDDTQAMRVSATTPEYARTRADEPNFIAPGRIPVIIAREHVIVP